MAKDRTPASRRTTGAGKGGSGSRAAGGARASGGRGRPVNTVVAPQRPWGLIAAAIAVVLFAAAVISYAVVRVNEADALQVDAVDEIEGIETFEYAAGQTHVVEPVDYVESPPVGGPHEPAPGWADCTGTVYDVDIRHENAVHSLEHGAVWIAYDPERVSDADVETLAELVEGESGRMMSPYVGLDSPISIQSWNHQLKVERATDERLQQFADFLTRNPEFYPEVGASCENPAFIAEPRLEDQDGPATVPGDAPPSPAESSDAD